ncbi:MAG: lysophospholipid acyltransferase family protein [Phycisphaerales bacterium JB040]
MSRRWASWWLRALFWCSERAPWAPRLLRAPAVRLALLTSGSVRSATRANAARLLGPACSGRGARRYALGVLGRFYDAVLEIGSNSGRTPDQIAARVVEIGGREGYLGARAAGRGAVLVTAHLGSFETAIAVLRTIEPRVHVVFRRDEFAVFERLRSRQRERLGVLEAPVDEGLATWIALRDALARDEVVLMQGDRCMPGQRGVEVPFLGGRLRVPTGPARLARLAGAPVIPVFAIETDDGGVRVELTEPIEPGEHPARPGEPDPITPIVAHRIEGVVRAYPTQWLCLHPVLVEDQHPAGAGVS